MGEWDDAAVDFGRAARDYGRHRQGFPDSFFERLRARGIGLPGQRVLDLGTGTGVVARALALAGARVTGLDRSRELLGAARELDRAAGVEVAYVEAAAEETGLAGASFDVVTAAQCWNWFEKERVLAEVARVLVPGGRLLIAQLDWLPRPGSVVAASEMLILAHNRSWPYAGLDGMPTHFVRDVERGGFEEIEVFAYDVVLVYTHEAWRGRVRASAGIAATLDPDAVERFDAEHARLLAASFPEDPLAVPHRVFALMCRASSAASRTPS